MKATFTLLFSVVSFFRVRDKNVSDTYKYIGSARLNGRKLKRPFLSHADIMNGGMLELAMTDRPTR
ncbi:hypothetical protein GCM10007415_13440 [Parapedobacter pyrenivorans]|uniref:Glycosyl hydrolase family 92 domain-containing protein n=1 Tax=Parapedobacter pyrenivorans TaxID=1305674 RepID=A0A917M703_9SPHI|nr:glycoside hydrolase domain-containing protein [Parapedobacter pyrenivorans]GGG81984.1 hypothetical protein GCM10007415_13440 [Parapedobacter pyrenivorans]